MNPQNRSDVPQDERWRANTRRYNARKREVLTALKLERGCIDCGYDEHPAALQFDHVRGEKIADVSAVAKFSWAALMEEVEKCDVVCANCHAVRTAERRKS